MPAALEAHGRMVAVIGDLQLTPWLLRATRARERNEPEQALLVGDLLGRIEHLAALVLVGDLVFRAHSRRDWAHFDALIAPFAVRRPVLPVMGNHDYYCLFFELCMQAVVPKNVRLRFPWLEPGKPYRVAFGDVALFFLDSETELEAQAAWLSDSLRALHEDVAAVVVFMHRAPYTDAIGADTAEQEALRKHLVAPTAEAPVPVLVVSGHEHGYEHLVVGGTHFVVSAGGGGARNPLRARRPRDVYDGPNCARDASGRMLRPFNYLLISRQPAALRVTVRGMCKDASEVRTIAAFELPLRR